MTDYSALLCCIAWLACATLVCAPANDKNSLIAPANSVGDHRPRDVNRNKNELEIAEPMKTKISLLQSAASIEKLREFADLQFNNGKCRHCDMEVPTKNHVKHVFLQRYACQECDIELMRLKATMNRYINRWHTLIEKVDEAQSGLALSADERDDHNAQKHSNTAVITPIPMINNNDGSMPCVGVFYYKQN